MSKKTFRLSDSRPDARKDVDDELTFHLEMRTREFMEQGMSADDARRAAARSFGDVSGIGRDLRSDREARNTERLRRDWWDGLRMDARYALRTLRKNPAFSVAAIATLALGLGATLSVFTVVNGVLLRPLPYKDPARLTLVWMQETDPKSPVVGIDLPLSSGFYSDVARDTRSFASIAAFRSWGYSIATDPSAPAEPVPGARVSPSLFGLLGARPYLGQSFGAEDAQPGARSVAVISYDLWQRKFGGDASIVGRQTTLNSESFTILGVMPPGFSFPRGAELPAPLQFGQRTDVWTPLVFDSAALQNYGTNNLSAIGRLKDGIGMTAAQGELSRLMGAFLSANAPNMKLDYHLTSMAEQAAHPVRKGLLILLGAVSFLLLIACANVVNLLLARAASRQRELAVRAAIGAGRERIARQLITENLALATTAGMIGIALAYLGTKVMLSLVPGSMPRADDIGIDWRVIVFAALAAILAGVVFGIAAAYSTRSTRLVAELHSGGTRSTGGLSRRLGRQLLVVAEVALSLVLLIGAALLTRSFVRLQQVTPGFDARGVITAGVGLPIAGPFNPIANGPRWSAAFAGAMTRLAAAPGIASVGAVSSLPLSGGVEGGGLRIAGRPVDPSGLPPHAQYNIVAGDYFRTMRIRLLDGRAFDARDDAPGMRTLIVNREFVRQYMAGDSVVVGRIMTPTFTFERNPQFTLIGVVDDVKQMALDAEPEPQVYVPQSQMPYPFLTVVARTRGAPLAAIPTIRQELRAVDPAFTINEASTMDDVLQHSLARQRFSMALIAIFAVCALVLAIVGLYGVIALIVGQRTREIGVRVALGATQSNVVRMVLGESSRVTLAGVAIGIVGALALTRVLASMLYGTSTTDLLTFTGSAVVVALVASAAGFIPARRAARVDPTVALRAD